MSHFQSPDLMSEPLPCGPWSPTAAAFTADSVGTFDLAGSSATIHHPHQNHVKNWQKRRLGSQSIYHTAEPHETSLSNWQPVPFNSSSTIRLPATAAEFEITGRRHAITGLDGAYAYCLDRGNGEYTRLIPADLLPTLNEIPAREPERMGMVVLPPLRVSSPPYTTEMNRPVTIKSGTVIPRVAPDIIQNHIDHIVAKSPLTDKRTKVYCDKWIHEGVCAFTQQGCKYKHEMPYDEATQRSLGLFQGLPAWWKKRQHESQPEDNVTDPWPHSRMVRAKHSQDGHNRQSVTSSITNGHPWANFNRDANLSSTVEPGNRLGVTQDESRGEPLVPFKWRAPFTPRRDVYVHCGQESGVDYRM